MQSHLFGFTLIAGAAACAFATPSMAVPTDHFQRSLAQMSVLDPIGAELKIKLANDAVLDFVQPEKIKNRPDKHNHETNDRIAVAKFYARSAWSPRWTDGSTLTKEAMAIMDRIAAADEDGLVAADYVLPDPGKLGLVNGTAAAVAEAEIALSHAVLAYTRHARIGRLDPNNISSSITLSPEPPDQLEVLDSVHLSRYPGTLIGSYNPPHEEFRLLQKKLAEVRGQSADTKTPPPFPTGPTLRLGDRDERVVLLRRRLGVVEPAVDGDLYDEALLAAVKSFQQSNRLGADGMVGPRTVRALNGGVKKINPEETILANMEQWRWMPRDLGRFHIRVNVPEFKVRVINRGQVTHSTRVVVGKRRHKTPIFSDEMEHVIVNPYWNVPLSIKRNEMLPNLMANPIGFTERHNYEVLMGGRQVYPEDIDWYSVNLRAVHIRQRPGPGNALGRIKFMFPNQHAVYLHDTPSKSLFEKDVRAFSHGCVRVQDPMQFADAILDNEPDLKVSDLKRLFGSQERKVNLRNRIPVHLTYFTAWADATGELQTVDDVYGHHGRISKCLREGKYGDACNFPRTPQTVSTTAAVDPRPREARPKRRFCFFCNNWNQGSRSYRRPGRRW